MTKRSAMKRIVRPLIDGYFSPSKTGPLWFVFANLMLSFGSSHTRVSWDKSTRMYRLSSQAGSLHVVRSRRLRLYVGGVEKRLSWLMSAYSVDKVGPLDNEIVVDIGANIGEFSVACEALGARVHAFEPDPTEFGALTLNLSPKAVPHNKALWSEAGKKTLWFANDSGDTSLIDSGISSGSTEVEVTTLDSWADEHLAPNEEIGLLKLEAEGAEPEILQGFKENVRRCRFIVVDAGFERGFSQDATLPEVSNFLFSRGFEMFAVGRGSLRTLFRRV